MYLMIETELYIIGSIDDLRQSARSWVFAAIEGYKPGDSFIISSKETRHLDFVYWALSFVAGSKELLQRKSLDLLDYIAAVPIRALEFRDSDTEAARSRKIEIDVLIFRVSQAAYQIDKERSLLRFTKVFDHMSSPLYFVDFIRTAFEKGASTAVKILSLNCLLILVGKYSYEYEDFYAVLYKLVQQELRECKRGTAADRREPDAGDASGPPASRESLFDNKHTAKFLKILEITLRSNRLSLSLTSSFMKVKL